MDRFGSITVCFELIKQLAYQGLKMTVDFGKKKHREIIILTHRALSMSVTQVPKGCTSWLSAMLHRYMWVHRWDWSLVPPGASETQRWKTSTFDVYVISPLCLMEGRWVPPWKCGFLLKKKLHQNHIFSFLSNSCTTYLLTWQSLPKSKI